MKPDKNGSIILTVYLNDGYNRMHRCISWTVSSLGLEIVDGDGVVAFYKEGWSHVLVGTQSGG